MRRLRLFIFLLPVVFHNYGCGLENITYLSPPGNPTALASPTNNIFTINSTSKNDEAEFLGFELYYKFYATGFSIPSVEDIDDLKSNGFKPVCSSTDTAAGTDVNHLKPLFEVPPVDRGTTFSITITFTNPQSNPSGEIQPLVKNKGADLSMTIRRDIADNRGVASPTNNQGRPFIKVNGSAVAAYESTDTDVSPVYSSDIVSLVMYAMSFGRENITTDLYSPPVYLGFINIYIKQ